MKGVILAAGKATRLYPITMEVSKMILPIYDKPVIYYSAKALLDSGVKDIFVICRSTHFNQIKSILDSYSEFSKINFKYKVKDHDLGMPYSILQAKDFAGKEFIMVMPGDNIFFDNYTKIVNKFKGGALVHLTEVNDPTRFGTLVYKNGKVLDIVEKPEKAQTNFALTAPYIFDSQVFKLIKRLRTSTRGELEITDLLKIYLSQKNLEFAKTKGYWNDVGTFDAIIDAGNYIKKMTKI